MEQRIPVTLLTRFPDSGKTTLLNKLLNHAEMHDTAIIINELDAAGLNQIFANSTSYSITHPPLEGWDEEEPLSRIVITGKGFDKLAIKKTLIRF